LNSLHPYFAFATAPKIPANCGTHFDGTKHCTGGGKEGIGKTFPEAQADLNRKLNAPKPKHHHVHHPPKHSTTINGNTFTKVTQATHGGGGNNILNTKTVNGKTTVTTNHPKNTKVVTNHPSTTTVKPILVRHPLSDPTTPKPTLTTGTAATGTGGNAIKQAQNKNQNKVITTTSPSSPVVNDVPTTTDTTTTPDTSTQQDTSPPPPSDTGNQTNVLLIGGAIFVGLMVLLLIV
jgi:hypothetical protein